MNLLVQVYALGDCLVSCNNHLPCWLHQAIVSSQLLIQHADTSMTAALGVHPPLTLRRQRTPGARSAALAPPCSPDTPPRHCAAIPAVLTALLPPHAARLYVIAASQLLRLQLVAVSRTAMVVNGLPGNHSQQIFRITYALVVLNHSSLELDAKRRHMQ